MWSTELARDRRSDGGIGIMSPWRFVVAHGLEMNSLPMQLERNVARVATAAERNHERMFHQFGARLYSRRKERGVALDGCRQRLRRFRSSRLSLPNFELPVPPLQRAVQRLDALKGRLAVDEVTEQVERRESFVIQFIWNAQ